MPSSGCCTDSCELIPGSGKPGNRPRAVIVLDASAALDLLLRTPAGGRVARRIASRSQGQLREGFTAYEAAYLGLAEALRAPLLTTDSRLAKARGHRSRVEVA